MWPRNGVSDDQAATHTDDLITKLTAAQLETISHSHVARCEGQRARTAAAVTHSPAQPGRIGVTRRGYGPLATNQVRISFKDESGAPGSFAAARSRARFCACCNRALSACIDLTISSASFGRSVRSSSASFT